MTQPIRVPPEVTLPELTVRGVLLGALITVIFTASNVFLGLKVGLTFSSAIPAAVISMSVLRMFKDANILENNMVQTQASAAGTLSAIIFILPALVMMGHWQGFPFWQTLGICAAGGMLGVMFTIPLRHVMVVQSNLPYPEGVAAAEILRVGSAERAQDAPQTGAHASAKPAATGMGDIVAGGVAAAVVSFAASGLRVLGDSVSGWFALGGAVF
ncbi:MAG: OPT family oligopeptide transporter, partial [Achromobacter mucicolens]